MSDPEKTFDSSPSTPQPTPGDAKPGGFGSFDYMLDGAVFRAAICKRCKIVLAVAIDEEEACKNVRVRHPRGSKGNGFAHEVWHGKDRMLHWFPGYDGRLQSCGMQNGMIVRISPSPFGPPADALGGHA